LYIRVVERRAPVGARRPDTWSPELGERVMARIRECGGDLKLACYELWMPSISTLKRWDCFNERFSLTGEI
jgi:hypothetical protein